MVLFKCNDGSKPFGKASGWQDLMTKDIIPNGYQSIPIYLEYSKEPQGCYVAKLRLKNVNDAAKH